MMYSEIFTKKEEFSQNLEVFEELYKQSAVRLMACADLLLPSTGELVPRFAHNLDPAKPLLLWRFRCRPMKRAVRYTQDEKKWLARLRTDMEEQRDRERESPGSGGLLVAACSTQKMVIQLGKMFDEVNKESPLPSRLLHGSIDEEEKLQLSDNADEFLRGVRFCAYNTMMTVGIDFRNTTILRAYAHMHYKGGDIRNVGQGLNRFSRPDPEGNIQCVDPTIYAFVPGVSFEQHRVNKAAAKPAPRILSLQSVSRGLAAEARLNKSTAPIVRGDGTPVGGNGKELTKWYTETNSVFKFEDDIKQSKDWHFLAFTEWCYYKRYPLLQMEEEGWEVPSLFDNAAYDQSLVRRVADASHTFDVMRTLPKEEQYVFKVCSLACADQPEDYGITPLTQVEKDQIRDHYGDNLHPDTLGEVAVRMVLYGHPLKSKVMDSFDREAAVRRCNGEEAGVADPNRHPEAIKRLAKARAEWGHQMIHDPAMINEDAAQLQAVWDAHQQGAVLPQYAPHLQQFVNRVLARHSNTELVDSFWQNANGIDDRYSDDFVPLSEREELEHKFTLRVFHALQSQLKLRTFVHPKLFAALDGGHFKSSTLMFVQHWTEQESVVRAKEQEYYELNPADKKMARAATLDAANKVAELLGLEQLQPCQLSQQWSFLLPAGHYKGINLDKLKEKSSLQRQELLGQELTEAEIDDPASAVEKVQRHQELCRKVASLEQMETQQLPELKVILQKYKSKSNAPRNMLETFLKKLGLKLVTKDSFSIEIGTVHQGRVRTGAQGSGGNLPKLLAIEFEEGKSASKVVSSALALVASSKCLLCFELVRACDWHQHKELVHQGEPMPELPASPIPVTVARNDEHIELIDCTSLNQYIALYTQAIPPYWHVPAENATGLTREQMLRIVEIGRELLAEARLNPNREVLTFYSGSECGLKLCSHTPSTGHRTLLRLQCLPINFLRAAAHRNYRRVLFVQHWRGSLFQRLLQISLLQNTAVPLPDEERSIVEDVVGDNPARVNALLLQQSGSAAPMGAATKEMVERAMSELLPVKFGEQITEMHTFNSTTRLTMVPRPPLRTHYDVLEDVLQEKVKSILVAMQNKLPDHGFPNKQRTVFLQSSRKSTFASPGLLVQKMDGGDFAAFVAACHHVWQHLGIADVPLTAPSPPPRRNFGRNPNLPPVHTQLYYDLGLPSHTARDPPTKDRIKEAYLQLMVAYAKQEGSMQGLTDEARQEAVGKVEEAYNVLVDTEGLRRAYDEGGIVAANELHQLSHHVGGGGEEDCAICMEVIAASDKAAMHGPRDDLGPVCAHTNMHFACVAAASQQKNECPMCRTVFTRIRHRGEFFTVANDEESEQQATEAQQREANRIASNQARALREEQDREFEEALAADRAAEAAARVDQQQAAGASLPEGDQGASSSSEEEEESVEARQSRLRGEFAAEQAARREAANQHSCEAAPQSIPRADDGLVGQQKQACPVFDPDGSPYVVLTECFHWHTAERLREEIIPAKKSALQQELLASHKNLQRNYQFTDAQIRYKNKGKSYLRECRLPLEAYEAYERHHKLMGKMDTYDKLPEYMAAAKRSEDGELGFITVRYDRKMLDEPVEGVQLYKGRAYSVVLNPDTEGVREKVLSLTAMSKQIRNALICHPSPLYMDADIAKCFPSIMLAASLMYNIDQRRTELLRELLSDPDPKTVYAKIAGECECNVDLVKQKTNSIISDPKKRFQRQLPGKDWLKRFENEIHALRNELINRHPLKEAFERPKQSDGSVPNVGSVFHYVLTDFEVKIIAVAAKEFLKQSIGAGTYEYDGLKLLKEAWDGLSNKCQESVMKAVTQRVNAEVFQGKAGDCIRFEMKPMKYEDFREALESGQSDLGAEGGVSNENVAEESDLPLQSNGHSVGGRDEVNNGVEAAPYLQFRIPTVDEIDRHEEQVNEHSNTPHFFLQSRASVAVANTTIKCGCCFGELSEADAVQWPRCRHKIHRGCMSILEEEGLGCPECAKENEGGGNDRDDDDDDGEDGDGADTNGGLHGGDSVPESFRDGGSEGGDNENGSPSSEAGPDSLGGGTDSAPTASDGDGVDFSRCMGCGAEIPVHRQLCGLHGMRCDNLSDVETDPLQDTIESSENESDARGVSEAAQSLEELSTDGLNCGSQRVEAWLEQVRGAQVKAAQVCIASGRVVASQIRNKEGGLVDVTGINCSAASDAFHYGHLNSEALALGDYIRRRILCSQSLADATDEAYGLAMAACFLFCLSVGSSHSYEELAQNDEKEELHSTTMDAIGELQQLVEAEAVHRKRDPKGEHKKIYGGGKGASLGQPQPLSKLAEGLKVWLGQSASGSSERGVMAAWLGKSSPALSLSTVAQKVRSAASWKEALTVVKRLPLVGEFVGHRSLVRMWYCVCEGDIDLMFKDGQRVLQSTHEWVGVSRSVRSSLKWLFPEDDMNDDSKCVESMQSLCNSINDDELENFPFLWDERAQSVRRFHLFDVEHLLCQFTPPRASTPVSDCPRASSQFQAREGSGHATCGDSKKSQGLGEGNLGEAQAITAGDRSLVCWRS